MLVFKKRKDADFLQLLLQSAENALNGARLFRQAMEGAAPPSNYLDPIKSLESEGDRITHRIYRGLAQVFITPLDREDILELAVRIDDVMDGIEASIARFDYMQIEQPNGYMRDFAHVLVESCEHIVEAFRLLARKKYLQIREHTVRINDLENEADRLMREGIRDIFTKPSDPYRDFKLKELYERLEETTDCCEDVADILESVVLKYA